MAVKKIQNIGLLIQNTISRDRVVSALAHAGYATYVEYEKGENIDESRFWVWIILAGDNPGFGVVRTE